MYEERIKWIDYKGKRILTSDYSNLTPDQVLDMVMEEIDVIKKEPLGSILALLNYENMRFNLSFLNSLNKLVKEYTKYYKADALLGVTGLTKVMYDAVSKLTKQEMKIFNSKNEALEWLYNK